MGINVFWKKMLPRILNFANYICCNFNLFPLIPYFGDILVLSVNLLTMIPFRDVTWNIHTYRHMHITCTQMFACMYFLLVPMCGFHYQVWCTGMYWCCLSNKLIKNLEQIFFAVKNLSCSYSLKHPLYFYWTFYYYKTDSNSMFFKSSLCYFSILWFTK